MRARAARLGIEIENRVDDRGFARRRIAHQIADREGSLVKKSLNPGFHDGVSISLLNIY